MKNDSPVSVKDFTLKARQSKLQAAVGAICFIKSQDKQLNQYADKLTPETKC